MEALTVKDRNPYSIMDSLDDEIIKAELENRVVKTWVYSFSSEGREQTGLSKVGVDACCTEMAKQGNVIREGAITFTPDPTNKEYVLFQGMATRYVVNADGKEIKMEEVNGTKRQCIMMRRKDKSIEEDPFWYEKGAMKAIRNARARLIPEEVKSKIIAFAKEKGRVKNIDETKDFGDIPDFKPPKAENKPQTDSDLMTEPQRRKLWAMMKEATLSNDEAKAFFDWYGHGGQLTKKEASEWIENFDTTLDDFQSSQH